MAMTNSTKKTTTRKRSVKVKAEAPKLPPNPFVHEILELASKQRTRAKKVEILQEYANPALKSLFIWNFDDTVISVVPEGDVPYKENEVPVGTDHTSLRREYKQMYHFVKGGNDGMKNLRRESMFINLLSGLHPLEAEIMCLVKEKSLEDKYKISRSIVEEAYPDIEWRDKA